MSKLRYLWGAIILFTLGIWGCNTQETNSHKEEEMEAITVSMESSDWEVLFDGSTLEHWRNYRSDEISDQWQIEEGTLTLNGKNGGDIITQNTYESFELELSWKISECGNSGIFFHVVEADSLDKTYHSGPEVQVLDNTCHPDAKIPKHRAGDNYDLHACSEETVKPAGEWNDVRLIVNEGHVEHWLNGVKVVDYQLWSPEWEELYQNSKFTKWPMYGRGKKGHIALQDHGDRVWFKDIKIKSL
ncbi:MAG: DUF1080 domain-containing protein [Bacteroidota bacterium]